MMMPSGRERKVGLLAVIHMETWQITVAYKVATFQSESLLKTAIL